MGGDLPAARDIIDTAHAHSYQPARAGLALLDGLIHLRQHAAPSPAGKPFRAPRPAGKAFRAAITHADQRLEHNPDDYAALDTKALALTGLTLTDPTGHTSDHSSQAVAAFRAARARTRAEGVTARIHRYLGALAPADPSDTIHHIRLTATNHGQ